MSNIREENILGGKRVIVGNPTSDLVLETLGKVFIKLGRSFVDFNTYMKNILSVSSKKSEAENNVIICTRDLLNDLKTNYPGDGKLIFNTDDLTLYICSEGEVLPLIEVNFKDSYVKKTGDVMTGQLEIEYLGSPLKVKSTSLVKNFNTEFLNGYSSAEVAIKKRDEIIEGKWDFYRPTTFRDNTYHYGASNIFTGSLQSRDFVSGYLGSGWKLDAASNTLTIDNLIVRKVLSVYELVVNKISALTGNFWVTNCAKCTGAVRIENSDSTEFVYKFYVEPQENVTPPTITHLNFNELVGNRYDFVSADGKVASKIKCNKILNVDGNIYDIINPSLEVDPSNIKKNYFNYILNAETAFLTRSLPTDPYTVSSTYLYDKYFKRDTSVYPAIPGGELWVMEFKEEEYPTFKPGDLIRCQKAEGKGQSFEIKYYDALILNSISGRDFIVQLTRAATSDGTSFNTDSLYEQSPSQTESRLGEPAADDAIVQIGNIFDTARLGSIYLTNSDNEAPYIDILDEVNRVDFSVISNESYVPRWKKVKANGIKQLNSSDPILTWDKYKSFYFANKSKSAFINSPYFQGYGVKRGDSDDIIDFYKTFSDDNYNYLILSYPVYNGNYCEIETDDENNYILDYRKNTKVRLGKLDGIYDSTFPADKLPYGYGLYGENVFLTGEFYLNNGKSVVDFSREGIFMAFENAGLAIIDSIEQQEWEMSVLVRGQLEEIYPSVLHPWNEYTYIRFTTNNIPHIACYNGNEYLLRLLLGSSTYKYQSSIVDPELLITVSKRGNPYTKSAIKLWGDQIYIYTKVNGEDVLTALFENGYFNVDLLRALKLESANSISSYYGFDALGNIQDFLDQEGMPCWELFPDGHGQFSGGMFRWTKDGEFAIRGQITAKGKGAGFYFYDEDDNPKTIISNIQDTYSFPDSAEAEVETIENVNYYTFSVEVTDFTLKQDLQLVLNTVIVHLLKQDRSDDFLNLIKGSKMIFTLENINNSALILTKEYNAIITDSSFWYDVKSYGEIIFDRSAEVNETDEWDEGWKLTLFLKCKARSGLAVGSRRTAEIDSEISTELNNTTLLNNSGIYVSRVKGNDNLKFRINSEGIFRNTNNTNNYGDISTTLPYKKDEESYAIFNLDKNNGLFITDSLNHYLSFDLPINDNLPLGKVWYLLALADINLDISASTAWIYDGIISSSRMSIEKGLYIIIHYDSYHVWSGKIDYYNPPPSTLTTLENTEETI